MKKNEMAIGLALLAVFLAALIVAGVAARDLASRESIKPSTAWTPKPVSFWE